MDDNDRALHLIVDASVLVYGGLNQLEKWYEDHQNYRPAIYYIPAYTLRELDFLKKSFNPVVSRNARKSIKFIDRAVSKSENETDADVDVLNTPLRDVSDFESYNKTKEEFERQKMLLDATFALKSLTISSNGGMNADLDARRREEEHDLYDRMNGCGETDPSKEKGSFESEEGLFVQDVTPQKKLVRSEFVLEPPEKAGPIWKIASSYRERTPLKKEFPSLAASDGNQIGVFGGRMSGSFSSVRASGNTTSFDGEYSNQDKEKVSVVQLTEHEIKERMKKEDQTLEEILSEIHGANEGNEKARIPKNLKLLIRSAIQLQRIDNKNRSKLQRVNWIVISEDTTTQIWLKCFKIPVMNISAANGLLSIEKKNTESITTKLTADKEVEFSHSMKSKKSKGYKKKRGFKKKSSSKSTATSMADNSSFAGVTYAPRGKGKLWTP